MTAPAAAAASAAADAASGAAAAVTGAASAVADAARVPLPPSPALLRPPLPLRQVIRFAGSLEGRRKAASFHLGAPRSLARSLAQSRSRPGDALGRVSHQDVEAAAPQAAASAARDWVGPVVLLAQVRRHHVAQAAMRALGEDLRHGSLDRCPCGPAMRAFSDAG